MIQYEIMLGYIDEEVLVFKSPVRLEIGDKFLFWAEGVKEILRADVEAYLERHKGPLYICDIEYYVATFWQSEKIQGIIYLSKNKPEL